MWHPWVPYLTGAAGILAICLPGREGRLEEAPFTRINELASVLAEEIAPWLGPRDVFCGQDFGALVAHQVARQLRQRGCRAPRAMVVCGAPAPDEPWSGPTIHRLSAREFMKAIERYYGPIPAEFRDRPEFLELLLPALRADLEAMETYRAGPAPPFSFPILAIAAIRDALVSPLSMAGWRRQTVGCFQGAQLDAGHFFVTEHAARVATWVRAFLAGV